MLNPPRAPQSARTIHVVLVPGFFGFDALGQIEYYAGTTEVFEEWRKTSNVNVTLHYFDNYPTAAVVVRATRLRGVLAKKIARGEILAGDEIALVGHSTGGLDIRQLLYMLAGASGAKTRSVPVGGSKEQSVDVPSPAERPTVAGLSVDGLEVFVPNQDILKAIRRVVFLSVPQYGTSLATFASATPHAFKLACGFLHRLVAMNKGERLGGLRSRLANHPAFGSDLVLAWVDALRESNELPSVTTSDASVLGAERAIERENRSHLCLWLEHMSKDVSVLHDLAAWRQEARLPTTSPANLGEAEREKELAYLREAQIQTKSFVTWVDASPADPPARGLEALLAWLPSPSSRTRSWVTAVETAFGSVSKRLAGAVPALPAALVADAAREVEALADSGVRLAQLKRVESGGDAIYHVLRDICATRPLGTRDQINNSPFASESVLEALGRDASKNDGVVNAISMAYPFDPQAPLAHSFELVPASDHADVIGHHTRVVKSPPPRDGEGRVYASYDIFKSGSGFRQERFRSLWKDIFDYCAPP